MTEVDGQGKQRMENASEVTQTENACMENAGKPTKRNVSHCSKFERHNSVIC